MPISLIMLIIELILKIPDIIDLIAELIRRIHGLDRVARVQACRELRPILKSHLNRASDEFNGQECAADLSAFKERL